MTTLLNLLNQSLSQHSGWVLVFAFVGGIVSSLLPCTIGMLPIMVGYVGGYSQESKSTVLIQIVLFVTGLALILTLFGLVASLFGIVVEAWLGNTWYYWVGIIACLMGLHLLNWIQVPLPSFITQLPKHQSGQFITPLLLGISFGAATSPCGTPFLATILGFISHEKNILLGGSSLFLYALGQSILLVCAGLFTGLLKHIARVRRVGSVINQLSGYLLILMGLMLIAQGAGVLNPFLKRLHLL